MCRADHLHVLLLGPYSHFMGVIVQIRYEKMLKETSLVSHKILLSLIASINSKTLVVVVLNSDVHFDNFLVRPFYFRAS